MAKSPLEEAVAASGLGWTGLSPVEFMANALGWAESIRTEGGVRELFPEAKSALIHEADIAALTAEAHAGEEHWLTGPEIRTVPQKASVLGKALGARCATSNSPARRPSPSGAPPATPTTTSTSSSP